jgi:hypothetical protein
MPLFVYLSYHVQNRKTPPDVRYLLSVQEKKRYFAGMAQIAARNGEVINRRPAIANGIKRNARK